MVRIVFNVSILFVLLLAISLQVRAQDGPKPSNGSDSRQIGEAASKSKSETIDGYRITREYDTDADITWLTIDSLSDLGEIEIPLSTLRKIVREPAKSSGSGAQAPKSADPSVPKKVEAPVTRPKNDRPR